MTDTHDASRSSSPSLAVRAAGGLLLVVAAAASAVLSAEKLGGLQLPGCGLESACARATSSAWGSIPGLGWPTSHVGVAYFLGLLAAWVVAWQTNGGLPAALRWIVRAGAIGSVGLVIVMAVGGYLCPYCVTVHAANLLFLGVVEVAGRRGASVAAPKAGIAFAGVALAATVVMAIVQAGAEQEAEQRAEEELETSTGEIVAAGASGVDADRAFTGRWRTGPEVAPVRVVVFSDYQCPDCKRIEGDLRRVLATRDDVSLSAKHFPFCKDCNFVAARNNANPHPNACWAARAAETAGMLGGNDAFWRMHHWLFDREGKFTAPEITAALPGLGFPDTKAFFRVMQGQEVLDLVQQDIAEAVELGLYVTPMIFINGVELTGWRAPGAVPRAIEALARTNPPALDASADDPADAFQKAINDWRSQAQQPVPQDTVSRPLGSSEPVADILVWGDYQEPFSAELDRRMRAFVGANEGVRYVFRPYTLDQSCNPHAQRTLFPKGCLAARAAEAAGQLGGDDAFWAMHEWLFTNPDDVTVANLSAQAEAIGLDANAFVTELSSAEVATALREDLDAGKSRFLRGVPFVFVNGKRVTRWRYQDKPVIENLLEAALRDGG